MVKNLKQQMKILELFKIILKFCFLELARVYYRVINGKFQALWYNLLQKLPIIDLLKL
jgi:hypothetical protein